MQKGKVYVHGNRWLFRYKVPTWVDGKKVWKDFYKDIAPADQYASEAALRRDNLIPAIPDTGNAVPELTQRFSDYVEQVYFPEYGSALKASTLRSYRQVFNCYVKPNVVGLRMCDFTLPSATQLLHGIARKKPLSTSSYQKIKWFGAAVFNRAKIDGGYDWRSPNPFADIPLPKSRKPKREGRYATLEDVLDMLTACDKIDNVACDRINGANPQATVSVSQARTAARVIALAAFSGLRKSEIQGLRWEHLRGGQIHVQQIAWRPTIIEATKTSASAGSVPVLPLLAEHLEAHRNGFPPEGFVFVGPKMGKPLDLHNLANRIVRPILEDASVRWCGWHGFRRGLASNLHALDVPDLDIQKIMRHSDVGVTQASYIKVTDEAKTAAMRKLQSVLGTSVGTNVSRHKAKNSRKTHKD
jgi:integrase